MWALKKAALIRGNTVDRQIDRQIDRQTDIDIDFYMFTYNILSLFFYTFPKCIFLKFKNTFLVWWIQFQDFLVETFQKL